MPDVAVALSGGVDSSVAAALLVEAGRDAVGVTMDLGLTAPGAESDPIALARSVCAHLGIPHVVIDVADAFRTGVVEPFCADYAAGRTPNPCVCCNERIKFGLLVERVRALGARSLATGHYARLERDADGEPWLARATDRTKDQSYFLYRIAPHVLEMLQFPLGGLTKAEVRALAAERGLPTASRRESQEVCFTDDHVALVAAAHPGALRPGPIELADGSVVGTHRGIARYTVGQRKGLGVGGPEGPYRVMRIDAGRGALIVAPEGAAAPARLTLTDAIWRTGIAAGAMEAQIRYRAQPLAVVAAPLPGGVDVEFQELGEPLAPGQSVVLYAGDRVAGGGIVPTHRQR